MTRKATIGLSMVKKGKHSAFILQEVLLYLERTLILAAPLVEKLRKTEPYAKKLRSVPIQSHTGSTRFQSKHSDSSTPTFDQSSQLQN
jgi:hypothetical protein